MIQHGGPPAAPGARWPWLFAVLLLLALMVVWLWLDGPAWLLHTLQRWRGDFATLLAARPVLVVGCYFAAYVLIVGFSFPGCSTALMVLSGALFGLPWGLLLASFAASLGGTLAMAVSRHVLRARVQRWLGHRLAAVNEGMARDGPLYLFMLRLTPAVPFFAVNLLMGLTAIRPLPFYGVTQLGTLPAITLYVNAGTQLAQLTSFSDIISTPVLLSLALLGVLPLLTKKMVAYWRARRARQARNALRAGAQDI
jgi:uncharacterized membrane protein YdjX (TVP38/TMEM64 family)